MPLLNNPGSRVFPMEQGYSEFVWGTVQFENPLSIRLDGETSPIGVAIDSLIDPSLLRNGDRVRCEFDGRRLIVWGVAGGPELYRALPEVGDWRLLNTLNGWTHRTAGGWRGLSARTLPHRSIQLTGNIQNGTTGFQVTVATLPASIPAPGFTVSVSNVTSGSAVELYLESSGELVLYGDPGAQLGINNVIPVGP